MKIALTILDRFEALVIPEPMSGCWLWIGAPSDDTTTGRYGRFRMRGKQWKAHRAAWALYVGPIPDGMHVLHRCDNQACVNPVHLFLGTNDDNVADRVRKGRSGWVHREGMAHPMSKLADFEVIEIRRRYADGEKGRTLAKDFKLNPTTISEIVTRRKWRHLP